MLHFQFTLWVMKRKRKCLPESFIFVELLLKTGDVTRQPQRVQLVFLPQHPILNQIKHNHQKWSVLLIIVKLCSSEKWPIFFYLVISQSRVDGRDSVSCRGWRCCWGCIDAPAKIQHLVLQCRKVFKIRNQDKLVNLNVKKLNKIFFEYLNTPIFFGNHPKLYLQKSEYGFKDDIFDIWNMKGKCLPAELSIFGLLLRAFERERLFHLDSKISRVCPRNEKGHWTLDLWSTFPSENKKLN